MGELETVQEIDGSMLVERVRDDLIESIQRCDLLPGQAISLRATAEQRRVKLSTLTMLLRPDERNGLLSIRGDVAVVAPLDATSLTSAFRIGRAMESSVIPRACELVSPAHLDRLARLLPQAEGVSRDYDTHLVTKATSFLHELVFPALTVIDRRVVLSINHVCRRHSNVAMRYLAGPRYGADFSPYIDDLHEVVGLLRAGHVRAASSLERQLCGRNMAFAEASLEIPLPTDDEQPIAQVIPIITAAASRKSS